MARRKANSLTFMVSLFFLLGSTASWALPVVNRPNSYETFLTENKEGIHKSYQNSLIAKTTGDKIRKGIQEVKLETYHPENTRLALSELEMLAAANEPEEKAYFERVRDPLSKKFSPFVPNSEALNLAAQVGPLLEINTATSYWGHLLRQRKADVVTQVLAEDQTQQRTLFLCDSPMDSVQSARLQKALAEYQGTHVLYVGGESALLQQIRGSGYSQIKRIELPHWPDDSDSALFLFTIEREMSVSVNSHNAATLEEKNAVQVQFMQPFEALELINQLTQTLGNKFAEQVQSFL